jgi:stage II sporulation protein D
MILSMKLIKVAFFSFVFFLCFIVKGFSIDVKIGLHRSKKIYQCSFFAQEGSYKMIVDGNVKATVQRDEVVRIKIQNGALYAYTLNNIEARGLQIEFVPTDLENVFKVRPGDEQESYYTYDDGLSLEYKNGTIHLINHVELDKYITGVIEAEIGKANQPELLRTKAIICRTYAVGHIGRHKKEGFDLCDFTHCQVYKGKNRFNMDIPAGVKGTKGQIIVDDSGRPIDAVFHSNCGGETVNSEDVWNSALPYLKSVKDSFCTSGNHARWQKAISIDQWQGYLFARASISRNDVCVDSQYARRASMRCGEKDVSLKQVRTDLGLYSTYFKSENMGDYILLSGKGFGHGVGLCQEGAIEMAKKGFKAEQIIHFYYTGVQIKTM